MASLSLTPRTGVQLQASPTAVRTAMAYQAQGSTMTLREGLAEYFREKPGLMNEAELPRDLGLGLHSHDVAHVVFGCDAARRACCSVTPWRAFAHR